MTDVSGAKPEHGAQNPVPGDYASLRPGAPRGAEPVAAQQPEVPQQPPMQPEPQQAQVQAQDVEAPAFPGAQTLPGAAAPVFPGVAPQQAAPGVPPALVPLQPSVVSAEMRNLFSANGIGTLALWLAALLGVSLVMAIICMIVLSTGNSSAMSPVGQVGPGAFFALLAGVVSGGFTASMYGGLGSWGVSATGSLNIMSIATLVTVGVMIALLARRAARREPVPGRTWWSVLLRSATEAVVPALIMLIIAAIARISNSVGGFGAEAGVQIQAHVFGAFLWPFLVVTVAAFWGRISTKPASPSRPVAVSPFVREVTTYLIGTHGFLLIPALVLFIVYATQANHPTLWMLMVPLGLNVAGLLFGSVQFSGVSMSFGFQSRPMYLWDMIGAWSVLVIVLFFVVLFVLSVYLGARRQRTGTFVAARIWQLPVGVLLSTLFAAIFMLPVSTSMADFGQGSMWMGPSWEFTLLAFAFAAIVSALAEVTPRAVYAMSPALLTFLAGRTATERWMQATVLPTTTPARPFNLAGAAAYAPAVAAVAPVATPAVPAAPGGGLVPGADVATAFGATAPIDPAGMPAFGATAPTVPLPNFTVPSADPMQLPAAQPMSAKAKRTLIGSLIGAGMVGLLIAGAFITVAVLNAQRDPANEVRAYLEAIADGDATAANAMLDPGMRNDERLLLTNEAFAGESTTIEMRSLDTLEMGDGAVQVEATYSLDGESFTHFFTVNPGPKEFLFLNTWELSGEPLLQPVYVSVPAELGTVTIGDVEVELLTDGGGFSYNTLYAYPGIYQVSYDDPNEYYTATGEDSLRVAPGSNSEVYATLEETDALQDEVLRLVSEQVEACVAVPTNMESHCPYAVQRTDLASMAVDSAPSGFSEFGYGSFRTTEVTFTTKRNPSTWNKNPKPETDTYSFTGSYSVVDGVVVIDDIYASWW